MTLDTWESLDRLRRWVDLGQIAADAGQTVEETRADVDLLLATGRAAVRDGWPAMYRAVRPAKGARS